MTAIEAARMTYHRHVFEHGCHAFHCQTADTLWAAWMKTIK